MKTTIRPLLLATAFIFCETGSGEILAGWIPSGNDGPRGIAYGGTGTIPGADQTSPGVLWTSAQRILMGNWGNAGAVWSGSSDAGNLSLANYTTFSIEVAKQSALQVTSFTYTLNCYNSERETINAGTPEEEVVLSTIQAALRSSLDDFATDIATTSSLPESRAASNNIPLIFDLSGVAALQNLTEPIEFRFYLWEESTVPSYNPFLWADLATGGCLIEGEVLTAVNREVLAAWIPTTAPAEGVGPANSTNLEPSKIILSPAVSSAVALNSNKGALTNRGAVWPASVNTPGLDENTYLETTVTPALGSTISLTDYIINTFNAYGTNGTAGWAAALRTSQDSFTANVATTSGNDEFEIDFDLSGQLQLQNLANPITLRLYLWDVEPTDGSAYDPFMFTDIVGADYGEYSGVQIVGKTGEGTLAPPLITSSKFIAGTGFVVEVTNATPGRFYDLFIAFESLTDFQPLNLDQQATGTTIIFTDAFANPAIDTKVFYSVQEAVPR